MQQSDYLVRLITKSGTFRAVACVTKQLTEHARHRHQTSATATVALGRALTGGALLGALLKTGQRLALKFEGNGPLRKIIIEAENNGSVRGYVADPTAELPLREGKLDVANALGRAGFLTVTKDLGLKEPYRGMVQLYTSEIGEDLAYYLTESEQIPSAVGLSVQLDADGEIVAAGGFLIQALPPVDGEQVDLLMGRIAQLPPLSELLSSETSPEELLQRLFHEIPNDLIEHRALAFTCTCRRSRIEQVLLSLGRAELTAILREQGEAEVICEFCREIYRFSAVELERLLAELEGS